MQNQHQQQNPPDRYEPRRSQSRQRVPVQDPLLYATFVSTAVKERNPFLLTWKAITKTLRVLFYLPRNRKKSKQRLHHMQSQVARIKGFIDASTPPKYGTQLDMTR